MSGLPLLTDAIALDRAARYLLPLDPETEITITPGATYGIYTALSAILTAGDEAIFFEPAYDSYLPGIELNQGVPVPLPLTAPGYTIDWDRLKAAITPRTRAIIVNTPHNPTGACLLPSDWDQLAEIVRDTPIVVISDEVYEQMIFDNRVHNSILLHPELRERSFAIYSFGKVFNNTGWKLGYVVAAPALTHAFRKIHQYLVFSVNTPAQYAIAQQLNAGRRVTPAIAMQQRRDHFLAGLKHTRFTVHQPAAGSYFQLVGYENISDMPEREFAEWLTIKHGVASIPVSAFYHNRQESHLLRFCFSKKEQTLDAALARLAGV